jgi:Uma2 family endonuclease
VSTVTKRLSVKVYDQMVEHGILPETNRFELINGRIVEKEVKNPEHATATERIRRAIHQLLPAGWEIRKEEPVRIPKWRSEPEPDLSVVRGSFEDYATRHPGPGEVALVVEVTRETAAKDRKLASVYGGGGIPAYWIVNVPKRQLEVYAGPAGSVYPPSTILSESETVNLVIDGQVVGQIPVAGLFPRVKP